MAKSATIRKAPEPAWASGEPAVPIEKWGKDHWSVFGYIETRIVDHKGMPDIEHMRVDTDLHPQFGNRACRDTGNKRYPTRLNDDTTLHPHDDWSCLDDCEALGLLENIGTGINRVYKLTDRGSRCAAALRKHKANGGVFHTFRWEDKEE